MKKLLLLFLLSNLGYTIAQTYTPFPDSGAVWVNTYSEYETNPWTLPNPILVAVDNYCVNGEDTLIGAFNYTKVHLCNGGPYMGAMRDNGGQVFFVPKDSLGEFIAYDFTAAIGDTVFNVYINHFFPQAGLHNFVIVNIDSIQINGDYRTVMYLDYDGTWIEGIGCPQGLFAEPWPNISMYSVDLACMSHNGEIFFPDYGTGACALDLGMTETTMSDITVFPVPTRGQVEIQFTQLPNDATIVLYNTLGEKIIPVVEHTQHTLRFNLSDFPQGIYFAHIYYNNQSVIKKIVKE